MKPDTKLETVENPVNRKPRLQHAFEDAAANRKSAGVEELVRCVHDNVAEQSSDTYARAYRSFKHALEEAFCSLMTEDIRMLIDDAMEIY